MTDGATPDIETGRGGTEKTRHRRLPSLALAVATHGLNAFAALLVVVFGVVATVPYLLASASLFYAPSKDASLNAQAIKKVYGNEMTALQGCNILYPYSHAVKLRDARISLGLEQKPLPSEQEYRDMYAEEGCLIPEETVE